MSSAVESTLRAKLQAIDDFEQTKVIILSLAFVVLVAAALLRFYGFYLERLLKKLEEKIENERLEREAREEKRRIELKRREEEERLQQEAEEERRREEERLQQEAEEERRREEERLQQHLEEERKQQEKKRRREEEERLQQHLEEERKQQEKKRRREEELEREASNKRRRQNEDSPNNERSDSTDAAPDSATLFSTELGESETDSTQPKRPLYVTQPQQPKAYPGQIAESSDEKMDLKEVKIDKLEKIIDFCLKIETEMREKLQKQQPENKTKFTEHRFPIFNAFGYHELKLRAFFEGYGVKFGAAASSTGTESAQPVSNIDSLEDCLKRKAEEIFACELHLFFNVSHEKKRRLEAAMEHGGLEYNFPYVFKDARGSPKFVFVLLPQPTDERNQEHQKRHTANDRKRDQLSEDIAKMFIKLLRVIPGTPRMFREKESTTQYENYLKSKTFVDTFCHLERNADKQIYKPLGHSAIKEVAKQMRNDDEITEKQYLSLVKKLETEKKDSPRSNSVLSRSDSSRVSNLIGRFDAEKDESKGHSPRRHVDERSKTGQNHTQHQYFHTDFI